MSPVNLDQAPILLFWETTKACNLASRHCRAEAIDRAQPCQLTTEQGLRLIDDLHAFTPRHAVIIFTGGDPFMRDDLFDLAAHARSYGMPIGFAPSVTPFLTRDIAERMLEVDSKTVSISGTPTPGNVGRNPRVRGNRFGSGFVVAGRADRIGLEIPALLAINTDASGDPLVVGNTAAGFPVAQLMNNSGTPAGPVLSICNDADAQPSGNIWCHGVEVLANSNIVISAESRQLANLVNRFGGSANGNHVVYGVFKPNGDVVKAYSLVSDTNLPSFQFNNSIGVTSNGFAIRFGAWDNSATFRLFDNDGNPTSTNINMAARVGAFLGNTNEPTT